MAALSLPSDSIGNHAADLAAFLRTDVAQQECRAGATPDFLESVGDAEVAEAAGCCMLQARCPGQLGDGWLFSSSTISANPMNML